MSVAGVRPADEHDRAQSAPPQGPAARNFVLFRYLLYYARRFVNYYLVRFWSVRPSGVTLATTHKADFFDPRWLAKPSVEDHLTRRLFLL